MSAVLLAGIDYDTAFKSHFDCSVSVQGMCRQLATEEEGPEGKKKTYWYSSFSTLNDFPSSHSLLLHHLHQNHCPSLPSLSLCQNSVFT